MKFSIFTAFYNYLDASDDLCDAIINQTYSNWEWLILDDFSENEEVSKKLIELSEKDERIKIIYPEFKKQYYYNLPIEHCNGDIIVVQDSDDIPYPKLLETYKHVYSKFDDLIMVSSSSLISSESHNGWISGSKYINYKKNSNYIESQNNGVYSIIGDCRSYKISRLPNKGIFVDPNDVDLGPADDIYKILSIERYGKFVALPRILHQYTMRSNSISGGSTISNLNKEKKEIWKQKFEKFFSESNKKINIESLFSIEKYYDASFDHFKNFYFSGIENTTKICNVEYWSDSLFVIDKQRIKDLYFDHNLFFNEKINNPDYIIVDSVSNKETISSVLSNRQISNCTVTITCSIDDFNLISKEIKLRNLPYWFNIHNYGTIKIIL